MKTDLFNFQLPDSLIATRPAVPRDSARMLVVADTLHDYIVRDLPSFLRSGDVMVLNNTKVIPARLFGRRGQAQIEILLHKHLNGNAWRVFAKPAKRLKVHDRIDFADDFSAHVLDKLPSGEVVLEFEEQAAALYSKLAQYGHLPLPPYIERLRHADSHDAESYQTIYAQHQGSVAAPTAGLHFTDSLMQALHALGVQQVHVTLHVGGGTFLPVKVDDTADHVMHSEYAVISPEATAVINKAKDEGRRIIAVGTTSLRTLESATDAQCKVRPFAGETSIFITPGYRFKLVDVLITNFHLPKSTLFMLVSAFCGLERMQAAYRHAISQHYRFYSYGDACLLYRHP